mmetsp:Transcript_6029/g.22809  ORF Transcript_6029/g.22809 Transcript_6029/m.22809 type:complete len:85 (+) Transcript_6029:2415-2669(+)
MNVNIDNTERLYLNKVQNMRSVAQIDISFVISWNTSAKKKFGTKLVVLSACAGDTQHEEPQQELSDDLLAVGNVFVAKNNGLRS